MDSRACITVLLLFVCFSFGSAQSENSTAGPVQLGNSTDLFCYECNPVTHPSGGCSNPVASNVAVFNCSKWAIGNFNWSFTCYSEFLRFTNDSSRTGIYRGCNVYLSSWSNLFCQHDLGVNVVRVGCNASCTTSRCNTHLFNSVGEIAPGGAPNLLGLPVLLVMTVSLLLSKI